jgi:DNA-binding NtrC family response regulator
MELLRRHAWPGNVRELVHVVEAAAIVCDGSEIGPEHLPPSLRPPQHAAPTEAPGSMDPLPSLVALERAHIEKVLAACEGHRGKAAGILGISERNLYRKLNEYGLPS